MPDLIKISPSDLTFLWDECPRCFWRKHRLGIKRPFGIMPGIFNRIDSAMKNAFEGTDLSKTVRDAPPYKVVAAERWVTSEPLEFDGCDFTLQIRGKFDSLVKF